MELNAEQIIKAMECCKTPLTSDCKNCSYTGKRLEDGVYEGCVNCLVGDALALIKQLTKENERLNASCTELERKCASLNDENEGLRSRLAMEQIKANNAICNEAVLISEEVESVRADTVREMQERLQKRITSAEYRANTERKTVKKEELIEQVNWVLHKVVPDTIDQIAKEMTDGHST